MYKLNITRKEYVIRLQILSAANIIKLGQHLTE